MTSRHLIDPELLPLLDVFPTVTFTDEILPFARQGRLPQPDATIAADVSERIVPGLNGAPDVRVTVYRPLEVTSALPAMLHIHGGGYVSGSVAMMDAANRASAVNHNCVVFSVDYRLAPETPHPGPVEDCYAALLWLFANAKAEAIDAARIGIKGESAGGGLAAAVALMARDRGEVSLAFQMLNCPMLDDRTAVREVAGPFGEYIWTPASNAFGWRALLGQEPGSEGVSPYASPARATDLAGLPSTFIGIGAIDLFCVESIEYARRLACAGVPVELHVYPGGFHGFEAAVGSRLASQAARDVSAALTRFLNA